MKRKSIAVGVVALAVVALIITGVNLKDYNSESSAATTQSSTLQRVKDFFTFTTPRDNEQVICLRDTNGDNSIKNIPGSGEWSIMGVSDCLDANGAPGNKMLAGQTPTTASSDGKHLIDITNLALLYAVTGSTPENYDGKVQTTQNTSVDTKITPQIQYTNSGQPVISGTGVSNNAYVAWVLGNLSTSQLADANANRVRGGIDKKKWKRGLYECTAFARDYEKTDPTKNTVTVAYCRIDYTCTDTNGQKKSYTVIGGHAFNDIHPGGKQKSYYEPQTGKNIDPDLDANGRVGNNEIFHITGVSEQLDYLVQRQSPGCEPVITSGPKCTIKSYENMVDAYSDLPSGFFPPGFNPN